MLRQRNELNFAGQNIYVGIDVHLKNWNVTILTEHLHHKTFTQPSDPRLLGAYLHKHFPEGTYHSAYEAGFSGLWAHYELKNMNVNSIVINPADVPSTQKEQLQKTDSVDSRKIARSLRAGELTGIYIPGADTLEARALLRARSAIVKDLSRMKQRIKSLLYFYGIKYPAAFEKNSTHWSKRFIKWLSEDIIFTTEQGQAGLNLLIKSAIEQRKLLLEATRKIRVLSRTPKYENSLRLLRTVPGIGLVTGMTLLTEIEDISRFANTDKLAGYIGLIPTSHSSGEKDKKGEMTFRGQAQIRSMLIESSWFAARIDPALSMCFSKLSARMEPNKAITRIARKVLNRIYYVLKYKKEYVCDVVR